MAQKKPSIVFYIQNSSRSGGFEERSMPCLINNFSVSPYGQILFDRYATKKAKMELVAILRARQINCHVNMM